MQSNSKQEWRRAVASALIVLGGLERVASWLSGSVFDDFGNAATNIFHFMQATPVLSSPTLQTVLIVIGIGLFLVDPGKKLLARAMGATGTAPSREPTQVISDLVLERQAIRSGMIKVADPAAVPEPMVCPQCEGNGRRWGVYPDKCGLCDGTGELPGELSRFPKCRVCNATGREGGQHERPCPVCNGYGVRSPRLPGG